LIFGETKYYYIIKLISNYSIFWNQRCFEELIKTEKYGIQFEELVESSFRENEWSNQLNTLGTSFALDRPIPTFSIERKNNVLDNKVFSHPKCLNNSALMIAFKTDHFVPLLPKTLNYEKKGLENIYYQEQLKNFEII
jgi:hypothetical protein